MLNKIIVTVNSELLISSLIIGNSMERILHAPYHSWVPQAWVTCYFAHEWNKMQIILVAIRGIVLIEGVCMVIRGAPSRFSFFVNVIRTLFFYNYDLVHTLAIIITSIIIWAFKVIFYFGSRKQKANWREGEDSVWWFVPAFPQKCFSSILEALSPDPPSTKANNGIFVLLCLSHSNPICQHKRKPCHSDMQGWPGINNTRYIPLCFTFAKKIGVSKNQHCMRFVFFSKSMVLFSFKQVAEISDPMSQIIQCAAL